MVTTAKQGTDTHLRHTAAASEPNLSPFKYHVESWLVIKTSSTNWLYKHDSLQSLLLICVGKELKKQKRLYTVLPLTTNPAYQVKGNHDRKRGCWLVINRGLQTKTRDLVAMLSHSLPLSLDQEVGQLGDKVRSLPQDYSSICSHLMYKCLKRDKGTPGKTDRYHKICLVYYRSVSMYVDKWL